MDNYTYLDTGFDNNFQRGRKDIPEIKQITVQDASTMFQGIPANTIKGGVLQSNDGKLSINLDAGQILYNDGVVDLFNLGGDNSNLTIKNNSNLNLLST